MKKKLFIFLVSIFTGNIQAQVCVYKTYDDYVNKKALLYDSYSFDKHIMQVTKDGKSIKINGNKTFCVVDHDSIIFRFASQEDGLPARVFSKSGGLFYYSSRAYSYPTISGPTFRKESVQYFSTSLSGEMHAIPSLSTPLKSFRKQLDKLRTKFPEYFSLFDCIEAERTQSDNNSKKSVKTLTSTLVDSIAKVQGASVVVYHSSWNTEYLNCFANLKR